MRLIDANAYLKKVCTYNKTGCGSCRLQDKCPVNEPTVDAEPVRHGRWIETKEFHGYDNEFPRRAYACSECHVAFPTEDYVVEDFSYCPNCGARMDTE